MPNIRKALIKQRSQIVCRSVFSTIIALANLCVCFERFLFMDMIATLGWIFFVLAAIVAAVGFAGQTEPKKRLTESEAKQAELIAALNEARKQPIASVSGGAAAVAYPVAKLPGVNKQNAVNVAEIKRLEAAVAEAQKQVRAEHARAEAAASRVVSAEAMVVQARSKATEAGHNALQEARKETESVRARLAEAEQHLANTAAPVAASADTERTNVLQAETASLQAQLRDAEARAEDTARHAERALREQFEARLRAAKHAFDTELENRVGLVREQFEAQQQRLLQEIETAKQAIATAAPPPLAEQAPPIRPRTRITPSIPSAETQTNEKPIVILADTDANACQLITKHLEAGGYAVRAVQSIADAVQAARDTPPSRWHSMARICPTAIAGNCSPW